MAQWDKLLARVLSGQSDANIAFDDLCGLLERLGFDEAIIGAHHIFRKTGLAEIVNIQPLRDGKAKPYQVRQVRQLLRKYGLTQIS
jgi:hypothetical protein